MSGKLRYIWAGLLIIAAILAFPLAIIMFMPACLIMTGTTGEWYNPVAEAYDFCRAWAAASLEWAATDG